MCKKADFIVNIQDDAVLEEEDDLDAALDSDPKLFESLLDGAIATNGAEPDSVDLQITLDLTALCKAIERRAERGLSEASLFRKGPSVNDVRKMCSLLTIQSHSYVQATY